MVLADEKHERVTRLSLTCIREQSETEGSLRGFSEPSSPLPERRRKTNCYGKSTQLLSALLASGMYKKAPRGSELALDEYATRSRESTPRVRRVLFSLANSSKANGKCSNARSSSFLLRLPFSRSKLSLHVRSGNVVLRDVVHTFQHISTSPSGKGSCEYIKFH